MSYRSLEIWKIAREVSVDIHHMTLNSLPNLRCMRKDHRLEDIQIDKIKYCGRVCETLDQ